MEQSLALAEHVPTFCVRARRSAGADHRAVPTRFPARAHHNAKVPYQMTVAGSEAELTAEQWALAKRMNRYWANFARTGDPNDGVAGVRACGGRAVAGAGRRWHCARRLCGGARSGVLDGSDRAMRLGFA
jgi:hypothetical protein